MKSIVPVIITLSLILVGCAAQHETAGIDQTRTEPATEMEQADTAAADSMESVIPASGAADVQAPEDMDYTTAKMSVNGVYNISYRSVGGAIRVGRIHSWELTISDANGQSVNDARVLISGNMPGKEYSLPGPPVATKAGFEGLYRVEDMLFNMPGLWTITVEVMADHGIPDRATFNLDIR